MTTERPKAGTYVLFELAGTTYGIRSSDVQQLEMLEHITPVPNAGDTLEGVVFSRGKVIPAINLRVRFGFERIPYDVRTRLVVVSIADRTVGLIVDSAREFKNIPEESIVPPPLGLAPTNGHYLDAIATVDENTILLLDLDGLVGENVALTSEQRG